MSRIEFGGYGGPIPDIAIPDPNLSSDLPIQVLELVDGVPFAKADWVALGYTHYEVWCIGGAGGLGGLPGYPLFPNQFFTEAMPPDVWAAHLEAMRIYDLQLYPPMDFDAIDYRFSYVEPGNPNYPPGGVPGMDYGWPHSHRQWEEHNNPGHIGSVTLTHPPVMVPAGAAYPGGGGGGGLHVMSGELADLPDSVPVEVGAAGVDAEPGQIQVNGAQVIAQSPSWAQRYVLSPNPPLYPPGPGGDGGTSSFGDICKASGGKGGHPAVTWSGSQLIIDGAGGDGGAGNRDIPGGGGVGSNSPADGGEGGWDGTVGKGGGGGRGGVPQRAETGNILHGV